jgi:signal recognition particle receptor subunit beta
VLRRLFGRKKKRKDEDAETELHLSASVESAGSTSVVDEMRPSTIVDVPRGVPPPMGYLVTSSEGLQINEEETAKLAKEAHIYPQTTAEIVPGRVLKRDDQGRIHIKLVFYGPSLSGKTTALRWLFANVRSLSKGKIIEISDELGRTTYFDFIPVTASKGIVFDVFTVAGQRRHARSRITVLKDTDGLIFMADSRPESMNENLASIQELRIALGTDRIATMPIIIALNKRDLPNALPVDYMVRMLDVEGFPIFSTIATEGMNLLRMFQRVLRDALIFKVGI